MKQPCSQTICAEDVYPWLPSAVKTYLDHTECGETIRALARMNGVHASTVLRQVQKTETRRDDPLVDNLLAQIASDWRAQGRDQLPSRAHNAPEIGLEDDANLITPHAKRLLRALMKEGTILAISKGVDTAVALKLRENENPVQLSKAPREVAEVMALREWISGSSSGAVSRYRITPAGRSALNKMMANAETKAMGFAEMPSVFAGARPAQKRKSTKRAVGADTPVRVLARQRSNGSPYLSHELIEAAERLQRDFALSQIEASGKSGWNAILAGMNSRGNGGHDNLTVRQIDARKRFFSAMEALGPELGEMAISVCCFEKGMEQIEAELGMPARSGKFMLRVALKYLQRHYGEQSGDDHNLIY